MWKTNRLGTHIQVAPSPLCHSARDAAWFCQRHCSTPSCELRVYVGERWLIWLPIAASTVDDVAFGIQRELAFETADAANPPDGPDSTELGAMRLR